MKRSWHLLWIVIVGLLAGCGGGGGGGSNPANRAPVAVGTIPSITLTSTAPAMDVDVASYFNDPDNDSLTYTVSSSAPSIATAGINGSVVTVTPVAAGSATLTITARDPGGLSATQEIAVTVNPAPPPPGTPVNQAPVAVGTIPSVTLTSTARAMDVDVASYFNDPDNDPLTYTVSSSAPSIATANINGSIVTVTPVAVGSATLTITAQDPGGLRATQGIAVTVTPAPNQAPVAVGTIPSVTLTSTDPAMDVNVASYFNDPDSDPLTYTVTSSDHGIATAGINGSVVTVIPVAAGSATLTITARDPGGLSATQEIAVTVNPPPGTPVNQVPVAVGTIPSVTLTSTARAMDVDVASYFNDPDNDSLTYTVSSSAPSIATANINGSIVTVTPVAVGSATLTITAQDPGGLRATQGIAVTVTPAPNQAPMAVGTIPSVTLTSTARAMDVDVASYFNDPDNDPLTYTVTSSDHGIATAGINGSVVTVIPVAAGSATLTITARDPGGLSATQEIAVTVNPAPPPPGGGGTPDNQAPMAVGTIPPVTLTSTDPAMDVDVASYFNDPDIDPLTYTVTSSDPSIATAGINGSVVTVTPVAVGIAALPVTARDPSGLNATQIIAVTVGAVPLVPSSIPNPAAVQTPDPADFNTKKRGFETPEYNVNYSRIDSDGNRVPGTEATDTHLDRINAAAAYARGATGEGETIVIHDTGILESHEEFANSGFSGSDKVSVTIRDNKRPSGQVLFHGTAVSGVAAANRDGRNMHGVAFEANLHVVSILLDAPPNPSQGEYYTPVALDRFTADDDNINAELVGYPVSQNLGAIINNSFGYSGAISEYDPALVREKLAATAAAMAQAGTDAADRKIIVWAAGNAGTQQINAAGDRPVFDSPELLAGLGVAFPELNGHVLAVVALDQDGTIADYSNRCGIAKTFCLAAPGSNIFAPSWSGNTDYTTASGTSFAAPVVSGALALLRHFFRNADGTYQLGNTELVTRLRFTANREGIYADSDIYGAGLIDLDAATRPAGALMTAMPQDPSARPLAGTGLELSGNAFGTRLADAFADVEMVGFDQLGAPFPAILDGRVHSSARSGNLPRALRTQQALASTASGAPARFELVSDASGGRIEEAMLSFAPGRNAGIRLGRFGYAAEANEQAANWWLSWGYHDGRALGLYRDGAAVSFLDSSAFAAPWLSLVRTGPGLGTVRPLSSGGRFGFALMGGAAQHDGEAPTEHDPGAGAILEYRHGARTPTLQTGVVWEADGFLGAYLQGAFGSASGTTTFAGFSHRWSLNPNWHALASGYFGWTHSSVKDAGLLRDISSLRSSAFSLGLERRSRRRPTDWLGLRFSQPLQTESGTADFRLPTGRTKYGEVLYSTQRVDLAPSDHHLQAEAAWRGAVADGELFLSLGLERHAQQDAGRALGAVGAIQFKRTF